MQVMQQVIQQRRPKCYKTLSTWSLNSLTELNTAEKGCLKHIAEYVSLVSKTINNALHA